MSNANQRPIELSKHKPTCMMGDGDLPLVHVPVMCKTEHHGIVNHSGTALLPLLSMMNLSNL